MTIRQKLRRAAGYWGLLPAGAWLVLAAALWLGGRAVDGRLRSLPREGLAVGALAAAGVLWLWLWRRWGRGDGGRPARRLALLALAGAWLVAGFVGAFSLAFSHRPEHVVTRDGEKLLGRVSAYLDVQVDYYTYLGPLYYGESRGYEYYGSGGADPFTQTPRPEPLRWRFWAVAGQPTDGGSRRAPTEAERQAAEDAALLRVEAPLRALDIPVDESGADPVFALTLDDFIESFNGYYYRENGACALLPPERWTGVLYDADPARAFTAYSFAVGGGSSAPAVTVNVAAGGGVRQVSLAFDDHGYTESQWDEYTALGQSALQVFLPDLTDDERGRIFTDLNRQGYDNLYPADRPYTLDALPAALYHRDGVGLYAYFATGGRLHFCITPVTETTLADFAARGVAVAPLSALTEAETAPAAE